MGLCWGQARAKCRLLGQQEELGGGRGLQSRVWVGSEVSALRRLPPAGPPGHRSAEQPEGHRCRVLGGDWPPQGKGQWSKALPGRGQGWRSWSAWGHRHPHCVGASQPGRCPPCSVAPPSCPLVVHRSVFTVCPGPGGQEVPARAGGNGMTSARAGVGWSARAAGPGRFLVE